MVDLRNATGLFKSRRYLHIAIKPLAHDFQRKETGPLVCDPIWFFAKALPFDEFAAFVAQQNVVSSAN